MSDSLVANILGSGMAGIIARIFTHPLDTAKARLQAVYSSKTEEKRHYKGTWDVLKKTIHTEGFRGLYRGFGAVLVMGTPGTAIYLCSYEVTKQGLSEKYSGNHHFMVHFTAGMIAEILACIVYVPVDVVKERMQVQHNEMLGYRNSWDAFKRISIHEGMAGIYKGYAATLGSFGPFSALYFAFYERFKYWTRLHLTQTSSASQDLENVELPFHWLLLCSSTSGALASWVTSPLDMAKLRLQVQRGNVASNNFASTTYKGVLDCLHKTYQSGGLTGLWRGAGARVLYTVPATTITMTSYETCRSFISKTLL